MNPKLKQSQALQLLDMMGDAHSMEAIVEFIVESTEDEDMSPCPFCGCRPLMNQAKYVFCSNHECTMHRKGIPYNVWQTRWFPNEEQTKKD